MNLRKTLLGITAFISIFTGVHAYSLDVKTDSFENARTCFRKPFSTYEEWLTVVRQGATKRFEDEAKVEESIANFKRRFPESLYGTYRESLSCETFLYQSDGTVVQGFVIKPKNHVGLLPVVIYNRGGNGRYGSVNLAQMFATLFPLVNEGFIVIGSQYRGSSRHSDPLFDDEFGGKDVNDVVNLAKLIPTIPHADPNRIGMLGASRGAMQSYLSIKAGVEVKALVTVAGDTDLAAGLTFRPEMENVYIKRIPDYQKDKTSALTARSALLWIDELNVDFPILLIHGEKDKRVGVFQSINMANTLTELNISHELIIYPEDDHNLRINRQQALSEITDWFQKHL